MRRLFFVLDLSLLRQQEEEARAAVLEQLTTAVGRLWAAYQHDGAAGSGGGSGSPRRHISWGYALFDSACPELLLKPKLRRAAQTLRLPAAFQETMQTDCRGTDLVHLIALLDAVTQSPAVAAGSSRGGEAPAAALARAVQSALSSSYLRKLQELAEDDSSSGASLGGAGGRKAEGLLVLLSQGLSSAAHLQAFLGGSGSAALQEEAAAQQLMAAALPTLLWQRCQSCLRVCWVAADAAAGSGDDGQLAVLPRLHALMQQRCKHAIAAPLADLAGQCSQAQFAARLALPVRGAQQETATTAGGQQGAQGDEEDCWPDAVGPEQDALENLKLLLASLEGHKEREADEARRRLRAQHRQLAKQRQHAMLPGAARRPPALVNNKGRALLENAKRLAADKGRKCSGSQPTSAHVTPEKAGAFSDDQHNLLAAAAAAGAGQGCDGDEAESGGAMPPEAAAADLKGRLDALLAGISGSEQGPTPAALQQQIRTLVDSCFASMQRHANRCKRQQQEQQQHQAADASVAEGGAGDEATSVPLPAPAAAGDAHQQPGQLPAEASGVLSVDSMRSLLLQQVLTPLADLRREHQAASESDKLRRLAPRLVLELLLRLNICAYAVRPGNPLPAGQYAEAEVLMQTVVATLHPIPEAGHDVFRDVVKKSFGARFPADMRRLQAELWDDDLDLDFDSMLGEMRERETQAALEAAEQEVSGETPGCSSGPVPSGPANQRRMQRQSSSLLTGGRSGRSGAAGAAGTAAGPSNLGRAAGPQREASGMTARPGSSMLSGENSGVRGGTSGATGPPARSGAAAALTATSQNALTNLDHVRLRHNNTKMYELQVRSKIPPSLLQKAAKLKGRQLASSRPPVAGAGSSRPPVAGAGAGSSRAAAAVAMASKGRGGAGTSGAAAAAAAPSALPRQPPRAPPQQRRQVPDTPDGHGKVLQAERRAAAAVAAAAAAGQQQQQQAGSIMSGGYLMPAYVAASPVPAAAPAADGPEAIPDTDLRPRLPPAPPHLAAAGAATGRLARSPSMRLDFNVLPPLPGAILPSQQQLGLDGGSANVSPAGGAARAEGPTWMVAATRANRTGLQRGGSQQFPAVASFGALVPSGALPSHPDVLPAASEGEVEPVSGGVESLPEADIPADLQEEPEQGLAGAAVDPAPSSEQPAQHMAAADPPAEQQQQQEQGGAAAAAEPATNSRRATRRTPAADAPAEEQEQQLGGEAAAAAEPAPSARCTTRRMSMAGTPAAAEQEEEEEAAAAGATAPSSRRMTRRMSLAGMPAEAEQQQQEEEEAAAVAAAAPSSRRMTRRMSMAGTPAEAGQQQQEEEEEEEAAAVVSAAPSSRRMTRRMPMAGTSAAAEQEEEAGAAAHGSRRMTRRMSVAGTPAAAEQQQQEVGAAEAGLSRRQASRHAPDAQPAAEQPTSGPAKSGRRSARLVVAEEKAPASQEPAPAAARRRKRSAQAEPALGAAADAEQLALIASLLGCKRCPSSKYGCLSCRPKAATALEEAGLGALLAGVGECANGKCWHAPRGCIDCWAVVKHRLLDPTAAAAALAAAPPTAVEGRRKANAGATAVTEAGSTPGATAAAGAGGEPAAKRRNTRRLPTADAPAEPQPQQQQEVSGPAVCTGEEAGEAEAPPPAASTRQQRSKRATVEAAAQGGSDVTQKTHNSKRGTPRCPAAETEPEKEQGEGEGAASAAPPPTVLRRGRSAGRLELAALEAAAAEAAAVAAAEQPQAGAAEQGAPRSGRRASRHLQQEGAPTGPSASKGAAKSRSRSRGRTALVVLTQPTLSQAAAGEVEEALAAATAGFTRPTSPAAEDEAATGAAQTTSGGVDEPAAAAAEQQAMAELAKADQQAAAAAQPSAAEEQVLMAAEPKLPVEQTAAAAQQAPVAAAAASAPAAVPDPVTSAMATAGALASQLDSGEEVEMEEAEGPEACMAPSPLAPAAGASPSCGRAAGHAGASSQAGADASPPSKEAAPVSVPQRRQSGTFPTAKRLGALQGFGGKQKKRAAESEATSGCKKKVAVSAPAGGEGSRSPLAPLLQQKAGRAEQPGSPYQGAYDFLADLEEESSGPAAAAAVPAEAAAAAAEAVADSTAAVAAPPADVAGMEADVAPAEPAVEAPLDAPAAVRASPGASSGLLAAAEEAGGAGVDAGSLEAVANSESEEPPPQQGSRDVSAVSAPLPASGPGQQQGPMQSTLGQKPAGVPAVPAGPSRPPLEPHEQEEGQGSDVSPPESAMPDSQLMPQSPLEVAGPAAAARAAGSQAPTPQTRQQRRLSPESAAWPGGKQQQPLQQQAPQPLGQQQQQQKQVGPAGQQQQQGGPAPVVRPPMPSMEELNKGMASFIAGPRARVPIPNDRILRALRGPAKEPLKVELFTVIVTLDAGVKQPNTYEVSARRLSTGGIEEFVMHKQLWVPRGKQPLYPLQWQYVQDAQPALVAEVQARATAFQAEQRAQQEAAQQAQQAPAQQAQQQQEPAAVAAAPSSASSLRSAPPPAAAVLPAAGPPPETQRHNAAVRQERRSSTDSVFVLPQSAQQQRTLLDRQQQEQQGQQPAPSPAPQPRALLFASSPGVPEPSGAPASVQRAVRRPPAPAHPSAGGAPALAAAGAGLLQQQLDMGLRSPARLPPCSVIARQQQQQLHSPARSQQQQQQEQQLFSPARGQQQAAAQRLHMPSPSQLRRLPLCSEMAQLRASPAPLSVPCRLAPSTLPVQQQQAVQPGGHMAQAGAQVAAVEAGHAATAGPRPRAAASQQQQEAEAAVASLLERARQEAADGGSSSAGSSDPAQQDGCAILHCTQMNRRSGLPELKLLLVLHTQPLVDGSPRLKVSHRCQTVVLAAGFNAEQLAPVKGVELEEADLGRANYQEKVEGVRAARHWRAMGRVSSATLSALRAATEELQKFASTV